MAGPTKEQVEQLWALHMGTEAIRERLLRSYGWDNTRSWVSPDGYRLSDRIWRSRKAVRDQIDALLRHAIATGTDALDVARQLEEYLDPDLAPVRNQFGRLIRNQNKVIVTSAPGRGGMGSFSARRLARTEITRAHGDATIRAGAANPFCKGIKWNLSNRHPRPDECSDHADGGSPGLPRGVYTVGDVPQYPAHPQCICFLTQETTDDIEGAISDIRAKYGLDE